jgi:hypothetical protein
MDRTVKILLAVIAALFVVCVCISAAAVFALQRAGRNFVNTVGDPTQGALVGERIVEYDLPSGYSQIGMRLFNIDMVIITSEETGSITQYMLMQFPSNQQLAQEEVREQMLRQFEQQSSGALRETRVVDEFTRNISGQEVPFIVVEGITSTNIRMRQMYGFFEGKGGQAMLSVSGMAAGWDQEQIDEFLEIFK